MKSDVKKKKKKVKFSDSSEKVLGNVKLKSCDSVKQQ